MSHSPAVSVAPQPPPMPTPHDVGPAIDAYLEYARDYLGFSPATLAAYGRDLQRFKRFLQDCRLPHDVRQIERKHIQVFANTIAGLAPATVRRRVYGVSALFRHLSRLGLVDRNPVDGVILPKRRDPEITVPSSDHCRRLVAACANPSERALMLMFVTLGLRRAELLALKVSDLSADLREVRVVGKGSRVRVLPIPEQTRAALREHLGACEEADQPRPLFPNRAGRPMTETTIRRLFERLKRRAGLQNSPLTLHGLRHGCASQLVASGVDVVTVQALLGHRSLDSTMRYLHTTDLRKRDAVEALPDYSTAAVTPGGGE